MLLPALGQVKETGKQAACNNNLSQIGKAGAVYSNDWNVFPFRSANTAGGADMVANFTIFYTDAGLKETKTFVCPSTTITAYDGTPSYTKPLSVGTVSYAYFTKNNGLNPGTDASCALASDGCAKGTDNDSVKDGNSWNHTKKNAWLSGSFAVQRESANFTDKTFSSYQGNSGSDNLVGAGALGTKGCFQYNP